MYCKCRLHRKRTEASKRAELSDKDYKTALDLFVEMEPGFKELITKYESEFIEAIKEDTAQLQESIVILEPPKRAMPLTEDDEKGGRITGLAEVEMVSFSECDFKAMMVGAAAFAFIFGLLGVPTSRAEKTARYFLRELGQDALKSLARLLFFS